MENVNTGQNNMLDQGGGSGALSLIREETPQCLSYLTPNHLRVCHDQRAKHLHLEEEL